VRSGQNNSSISRENDSNLLWLGFERRYGSKKNWLSREDKAEEAKYSLEIDEKDLL
jgi:hypothetical protein